MRWSKWIWAGLGILAGVAVWLLMAGPESFRGADLGAWGFGLLVLVAATAMHGVSVTPRGELEDTVSPGEWRAWIGLVFMLVVAGYLLSKSDLIVAAEDVRDLGRVGRNIVLLLVAWAVFSQVLHGRWKGKVLEDERDRDIEVRASGWARGALMFCVFGVVVMLGFSPAGHLAWASPIAIAHILIFALVWHVLVEYAVTAISYWWDRRP